MWCVGAGQIWRQQCGWATRFLATGWQAVGNWRSAFALEIAVEEFEVKYSPLCQTLSRDGVTLEIQIYEGDPGQWLLEVVNEHGTSIVWDAQFDHDADALAAVFTTIDDEGIGVLTGK